MKSFIVYHHNMYVNQQANIAAYRPIGIVKAEDPHHAIKVAKNNLSSVVPVIGEVCDKAQYPVHMERFNQLRKRFDLQPMAYQ